MDDPDKPAFAANYFTGVPAPAGAICVLLPMYLVLVGLPQLPATLTALYVLAIGFLMVSRLPVFSGKTVGSKVQHEMVLPVVVLVVSFIALLISYPWHLLSVCSVLYLAFLPLGWMSYRKHESQLQTALSPATGEAGDTNFSVAPAEPNSERPTRLN